VCRLIDHGEEEASMVDGYTGQLLPSDHPNQQNLTILMNLTTYQMWTQYLCLTDRTPLNFFFSVIRVSESVMYLRHESRMSHACPAA
jgi:hypothetical protein